MLLTNAFSILAMLLFFKDSGALNCHQCNGWSGRGYKPGSTSVSTCDNRNNQCKTSTTGFCVKMVDPIDPSAHYVTYKSDCWFDTTVLVNNSITQTVNNKACYSWSDGGTPSKTYLYCFCNDSDFCNSADKASIMMAIAPLLLAFKSLF